MAEATVEVEPERSVDSISKTDEIVRSSPPDATPAKKGPPPESVESIRTRCLVIISFWAIVILLGLPTWLRTTSIYRAQLPLEEMLEWADGKVSGRSFTFELIGN